GEDEELGARWKVGYGCLDVTQDGVPRVWSVGPTEENVPTISVVDIINGPLGYLGGVLPTNPGVGHNAAVAAAFPNNYLDIRSMLIAKQ
ncbi:hypothetical protein ACC677_37220, partial [Rhizobium ruizarguesonis]